MGIWVCGIATATLPIPFGGTQLSLVVSAVFWLIMIGATWLFGCLLGRPSRLLSTTITLALCVVLLNWCAAAPRAWFEVHRKAFEAGVHAMPPSGADRSRLPIALMWLTVDGDTEGEEAGSHIAWFFPQWEGMPDDAGGYFYSPDRSPDGLDMRGMICRAPIDLGSGWWMCGM
ncbi:MAG: hypothetical protein FWE71_13640 [Nocardioidaceae bacterium]|nr:hypothetical protein [Nocardioidaceae bacterium]MCL2612261.1 hypothetical protein [Nocardioidaceae bacterium]